MVRHEPAVSVPSATGSPVRTCIGCRKRAPAAALLRLVARADDSGGNGSGVVVVVPDLRGRLPGRGAWLHPHQDCLDQAQRRRAFGRALRVAGQPDLAELSQLISNRTGTSTHEHNVKHQR